jgi:hypothetical protein
MTKITVRRKDCFNNKHIGFVSFECRPQDAV